MFYLQKELNTLIKEDESIFEFLQNSSLDGLWYWDLEKPENEWMNNKFWQVLGFNPDEMPHKTSSWQDLINLEDFERMSVELGKHLADPNYAFDQIVRYKHSEGHTKWIRCRGVCIRNSEGKPLRMLGAHIDISDLKNYEFELTNSNEKLEKLTLLLNDAQKIAKIGAWELELETGKTVWTEEVYSIHEVDKSFDHNSSNGIEFYHPDYREIIKNAINNSISNQTNFDVLCRFITARNNHKWVRASGHPIIKDGKVTHIAGIFQDVSKIEEDKNKIQMEQLFSKQLIENMADGFSLVDKHSQQINVNESFCKMLGYTREELIGKQAPYPYWYGEVYGNMESYFEKTISDGKAYFEVEFIKKDGGLIPVHISSSCIRGESGEIVYLFANIKDMTEQKNNENELKRLLAITEEQNKRLMNFAHIVSHNLRNHSGNITAITKIIEEENPEISDSQYLGVLKSSSKQLSETIEDLSLVVKESITVEKQTSDIDIWKITNSIIQSLMLNANKKNVKLINEINTNKRIKGIIPYINSVVLNFLTNSIKYSDEKKESYSKVSIYENENYDILIFEDNGLGINLEKYGSKLFGLFNTFHKGHDSRGVGMYITKNQVEVMGGYIEVESQEGVGTTFKVYLKK
jgi:PAS domain S-box-containing protein